MIHADHISEAQKLEMAGIKELFQIQLVGGGNIYITNGQAVTWQGVTYDSLPVQLSGVETHASEQEGTPTLTIMNPESIFTPYIVNGSLERATVVRKHVLSTHLIANQNISNNRSWYVNKISKVNPIVLELRELSSMPGYLLPGRMFMPPEFPFVSLQ